MEKITFNSIDELYNRLKPAFRFKLNELKSKKMSFVTSKDIWTFLSKSKWSKQEDLELCDMVDDIMNINETELINFISQNR